MQTLIRQTSLHRVWISKAAFCASISIPVVKCKSCYMHIKQPPLTSDMYSSVLTFLFLEASVIYSIAQVSPWSLLVRCSGRWRARWLCKRHMSVSRGTCSFPERTGHIGRKRKKKENRFRLHAVLHREIALPHTLYAVVGCDGFKE